MSEEREVTGYGVECGDGTGGRVAAKSPGESEELASEMCQVHGGLQQPPEPQAERGAAAPPEPAGGPPPEPAAGPPPPVDTAAWLAEQWRHTCEPR